MDDKLLQIKKNILDLKHSENISFAVAHLSIGTGGAVTILASLGLTQKLVLFSLFIFTIFGLSGLRLMQECKIIRTKIADLAYVIETN